MHYTCLVIGPDYKAQLEPFDENTPVKPYKAYWDSRELESWERILQEREGERRKEGGAPGEMEKFTYPEEQVLASEYELDDMARVYRARYLPADDEGPEVDDGGIFEWSTYNPQSKWDWYAVGGRWTGFFKLKPGRKGETGRPGFMTEPALNGYVDVALKGDVDIEGMRQENADKAAAVWDRIHAVIGHLPEALGWESHFVGRLKLAAAGEDEYSLEQAREDYYAQPRVIRLKEWNDSLPEEERLLDFLGPAVEDFQMSREEYVQSARDNALATYAYLYEGEWHAPGKMGWFSSSDTEKEKHAFVRQFNDLLDSLPDDTELTLVDLHI